jgi:hypothetical protein
MLRNQETVSAHDIDCNVDEVPLLKPKLRAYWINVQWRFCDGRFETVQH